MQEEEILLKRKIEDLARRCYETNQYLFTGFLSLSEQAVFHEMEQELSYVDYDLWGGPVGCERKMIRFGSMDQLGYEEDYPVSCITVKPLMKKFAENLTHRDYLGALMHLGIERSVLGDIILREEAAYIICTDKMVEYVAENLDKIRHTSVYCTVTKDMPPETMPVFLTQELIVSSCRCDSIVAKAWQMSRNQSLALFRAKKIFVNGRQYENNSGLLKEEDIVSVRGFGKFIYDGVVQETKKGHVRVKIRKYA